MIKLSIVGYIKNNRFYLMCLDTDILVVADSFEEAKQKMLNALISYLRTFTHKEILDGRYIRRAPLKFWMKYYLGEFLSSLINLSRLKAKYDVKEENLRFA